MSWPSAGKPSATGLIGSVITVVEEARADLGAAADVDDRDASQPPTLLEEPRVRVGIPRLARRAERAERREVRVGLALRDQRAHERRREAEHRHLLRLDEPPEAVARPVGRALGEDDRRADGAAADDGPRPHDPAHVGGEVDAVAALDVGLVRGLARDRDEEAALHVQRALRPAGRARRVGEQVRRLGVDLDRRRACPAASSRPPATRASRGSTRSRARRA